MIGVKERKLNKSDYRKIDEIVTRGRDMAVENEVPFDRQTSEMDIIAAHDDVGLDFDKFLGFSDGDFGHDFFGILRYIDRETGELTNCFLPRCTKRA